MKTRAAIVVLVVLGVAGCGGARHAAPPESVPKLPRVLAQSWARQADDVAAAVDAGDGCTARRRAVALRKEVVGAVNAHRVPRRYLEPLVSTANDLAGRIVCTPPAPAPAPVVPAGDTHDEHDNGHGKHGGHDKPPGHDKHGKHGKGGD
jgi:hypothetical protein